MFVKNQLSHQIFSSWIFTLANNTYGYLKSFYRKQRLPTNIIKMVKEGKRMIN